ncbi:copper transport protein [Heterostelium album PN500]|uniref:Copper transport protein n=1 Tax=Heterostelium pallidum (strain ATCC 26659 / Pp 5 / PN500) TaxID=670386 RepID=D3BAI6_HETP5|nr:copper transport protein [Heterostelium album PN500]EFA81573.1 copper transport protein [Heterostelium album PN500]|eukprot:XP_020433690.1 copper transport protein [Heterostelium album PN500]
MTTYTFNVDMTCGGCSKAVNAVLSKLDGVSNIKIDLATKTVVCDSANLSAQDLLTNIQKTGKKASIVA